MCNEAIEVEELELMVVTADHNIKTQQEKVQALVLWFEDVGMSDVALVGGKNLSNLRSRGRQARVLILNTPFLPELNTAIEVTDIDKFQPGEVLVTNKTDPDWDPIMKQASAIVSNQGDRTCHAGSRVCRIAD